MSIIKQYVLFFILVAIFIGAYAKFGRADSIICSDIIFTETSRGDVEAVGDLEIRTVPVRKISNTLGRSGGITIEMHSDLEIFFSRATPCMLIGDDVDSTTNLAWVIQKSKMARLSRYTYYYRR